MVYLRTYYKNIVDKRWKNYIGDSGGRPPLLLFERENKLKSLLKDGNLHTNTNDYLKIIHDLRVE